MSETPDLTVTDWLEAKVTSGALQADPAQAEMARALDAVMARIRDYDPDPGFLGLFNRTATPKGLYLFGGVGRGKSMLMDVFFRLCPVEDKRRVHFHAFLIDVHARINAWRKLDAKARRASPHHKRGDGDDPIAPVARALVADAYLLCFDEFQVTDIGDASILGRLFDAMWAAGCVVVATSNRPPEDLYKNGLNRARFVPFVERMPDHFVIHDVNGSMDHRLRALTKAPVFYAPLSEETADKMDAAWERLSGQAALRPVEIIVHGRTLRFERTASGMAREKFFNLCERPLGAADYLALAETFHTLMLENVPIMGRESRNEAKRFVALIDALYETKTKLIMSAEAEPHALYPSGDGSFEFARTISRLIEMQSEDYLAAARQVQTQEVRDDQS